jgi:hypothetical protein
VFTQSLFHTVYTERIRGGAGLTYTWFVTIPADWACATGFQPNTPTPNKATWFHADESEGGPCNHNGVLYGPKGHPGTVTVVAHNASWSCIATFVGTISGRGPAPTCTPAVELTRAAAGKLYLEAVTPVNDAQATFYAKAETWSSGTANADAQAQAVPLGVALDEVGAALPAIAAQYPPAADALAGAAKAADALERDLALLSQLDKTGVNAWARRYDADRSKLVAASDKARSALGLSHVASG